MHFQFSLVALFAIVHAVSAHTLFTTSEALAKSATEKFVSKNAACDPTRAFADPPTIANSDGTFDVFARSFNPGQDGTTAISAPTLDTTGAGTSFPVNVAIITNGNKDPAKKNEVDKLVLQFPTGTTCMGPNNTCLVQIASLAGFSNCITLQTSQADASTINLGSSSDPDDTTSSTSANCSSTDTATSCMPTKTHHHHHHHHTHSGSMSDAPTQTDIPDIVTVTLTVTVTQTTPSPTASEILLNRRIAAGAGAGAKRVRSRAFVGIPEDMYI